MPLEELIKQILGQRQGVSLPTQGGLLGSQAPGLAGLAQQNNFGAGPLGTPPIAGAEQGPPTLEEQQAAGDPRVTGTGFGGFFGNLDTTLQSPSRVLGLGLLGRIDPRLSALGLLGSGVFGKNKVF